MLYNLSSCWMIWMHLIQPKSIASSHFRASATLPSFGMDQYPAGTKTKFARIVGYPFSMPMFWFWSCLDQKKPWAEQLQAVPPKSQLHPASAITLSTDSKDCKELWDGGAIGAPDMDLGSGTSGTSTSWSHFGVTVMAAWRCFNTSARVQPLTSCNEKFAYSVSPCPSGAQRGNSIRHIPEELRHMPPEYLSWWQRFVGEVKKGDPLLWW